MTQTTPSANGWVVGASRLLKRGLMAAARLSQSANRPSAYSDRRAEPRLRVDFLAQISGESGLRWVRGVNITSGGALLLAAQPLPPQSMVLFHVKSLGLMGFAQVRHCAERGMNSYAIGVSFPSPLMRDEIGTWQFHRVHETDGGWSVEVEASMNLSPTVRAA